MQLEGQDIPDDCFLVLTLHEALDFSSKSIREKHQRPPQDLQLFLQKRAGSWLRVGGWGGLKAPHLGIITADEKLTGQHRLSVIMRQNGDSWIPAHYCDYEVLVTFETAGITGTFSGRHGQQAVSGAVSGRFLPVREQHRDPAAAGEHPRLLFRAADLPDLRAKLQTEFGQAAMQKWTGVYPRAHQLAVKYQLTGDKKYADACQQAVEELIKTRYKETHAGWWNNGRVYGYRLEALSIAYDCCVDVWPRLFSHRLRLYIAEYAEWMLYEKRRFKGHINWTCFSNYGGPILYGAGFAGLALWGEKGSAPPKPDSDDTRALAIWDYDKQEYQRSGGLDQRLQKLYLASWLVMYRHFRLGVGTGGFQSEVGGYSIGAHAGPNKYASAHRMAMGLDVTPFDDMQVFIPRKIMSRVYNADGSWRSQDINGTPSMPQGYYSALFPVVPEQWKPAVLWAWRQDAGVDAMHPAAGWSEKILGDDRIPDLTETDAVRSFLYYPLHMQAQAPAGLLPLTWSAPEHGYFVFRNAWNGSSDCVLQLFGKGMKIGGWQAPNAGSFRLRGLGHVWASGSNDKHRDRFEENALLYDEPPHAQLGLGKVLFVEQKEDGSGVVSFDLSTVYARPDADPEAGPAIRSIAVDYSGRSGVPCIMAIADHVPDHFTKTWAWHLPAAALQGAQVAGDTFTVTQGNAMLFGKVIAPADAQISIETRHGIVIGKGGSKKGKPLSRKMPGIYVQGPTKTEGEFLVLLGLTTEKKIPVIIATKGRLQAPVTVGDKTFQFNGQHFIAE